MAEDQRARDPEQSSESKKRQPACKTAAITDSFIPSAETDVSKTAFLPRPPASESKSWRKNSFLDPCQDEQDQQKPVVD